MSRIDRNQIDRVLRSINHRLGFPISMFDSSNDCLSIGHIYVDKNSTGWQIEQIISRSGAAKALSNRMSCREAFIFVLGMQMSLELMPL